jgi:hypothetical protein
MYEGEMLTEDYTDEKIKLLPFLEVRLLKSGAINSFYVSVVVRLLDSIQQSANVKEAGAKAGMSYSYIRQIF